jgi:hypothetical protein
LLPRNRLTAGRSIAHAEKQAGNADVFVQIVPMEPGAAAANLKLSPLLGRCRQESWEVGQWDGQLTAIGQVNPEVVGVKPDPDSSSPALQRTHSTPFQSVRGSLAATNVNVSRLKRIPLVCEDQVLLGKGRERSARARFHQTCWNMILATRFKEKGSTERGLRAAGSDWRRAVGVVCHCLEQAVPGRGRSAESRGRGGVRGRG